MYVSLDRKTMRFLHKHPNITVITNLAYIEVPDAALTIVPVESRGFLHDHTDMELKILYRETTGEDVKGWLGPSLKAILYDLADRLEVDDVQPYEVERQANFVEAQRALGKKGQYLYTKGSFVPTIMQELFENPALNAERAPNEPAVAAKHRAPPAHAPVCSMGATTPAPRPRAQPSAPQGPQRAGGVRETIWAVADKIWEEAGKITDKSRILQLRKGMMDVLEKEHGVKRTSSSNELGNWMKNRIQ